MVSEAALGGKCTVNETCITDDSYCSLLDDEGACACITGYVESALGTECEQGSVIIQSYCDQYLQRGKRFRPLNGYLLNFRDNKNKMQSLVVSDG